MGRDQNTGNGNMSSDEEIPYKVGEWLVDRANPQRPGRYTGRHKKMGPHIMLELTYLDGSITWRPLDMLEPMQQNVVGIASPNWRAHGPTCLTVESLLLSTIQRIEPNHDLAVYVLKIEFPTSIVFRHVLQKPIKPCVGQ